MLQLLICEVDHLPTVATRDLLFVCQQFDQLHICLVAVRAMKLKTKLFGIDHWRLLARQRARGSDRNKKPRRCPYEALFSAIGVSPFGRNLRPETTEEISTLISLPSSMLPENS